MKETIFTRKVRYLSLSHPSHLSHCPRKLSDRSPDVDLDHFMDHAHIDEVEEERVREFTGEDSIPHHHAADAASPAVPVARDYLAESIAAQQKILAAPAVPVRASREESARIERATLARAQAAKFGKEAREARLRGEWIDEDFGVPRDAADRLRKAVPYKFKVRKNWWGEF